MLTAFFVSVQESDRWVKHKNSDCGGNDITGERVADLDACFNLCNR